MSNTESNNTEELNDLKSLWKGQKDVKTYSEDDIFKMLHRKSINYVQWIFIISIIELLIGVISVIWTMSGKHYYSNDSIKLLGAENVSKIENFSTVGIFGSLILIGIIFYFYRKISSKLSVNDLMKSILNFRKSIICFFVLWFVFSMSIMSPIIFQMGRSAYLNGNLDANLSAAEVEKMADYVGWSFFGIMFLIILIFCLVYYFIIYGLLLRRLNKNYKELKKLSSN